MTITLANIRAQSAYRPAGYFTDVISRGKIVVGEVLELTDEAYAELCAKYRKPEPERTVPEMISHLAHSLGTWAHQGFPVASREQIKHRLETCRVCEHRLTGLVARCRLCDCTDLKVWLATERCPAQKWS